MLIEVRAPPCVAFKGLPERRLLDVDALAPSKLLYEVQAGRL